MGVRRYTTRIEAAKEPYPVLLSNGNLLDSGDLPGGRWAPACEPSVGSCPQLVLEQGFRYVQEHAFMYDGFSNHPSCTTANGL